MGHANLKPFDNLVKIAESLSSRVTVVEVFGDEIPNPLDVDTGHSTTARISHSSGRRPLSSMLRIALTQLRISIQLLRSSRRVDFWIFFMGDSMVIPTLTARLSGKPVILVLGHYLDGELKFYFHVPVGRILKALKIFKGLILWLSNWIVVYSPRLIKEWQLERYKEKILFGWEHLIDFERFRVFTRFQDRDRAVGYVGRLSAEKGVMNFVRAIPLVLERDPNLRFAIVGSGSIESEIVNYVVKEKLIERVRMTAWVPHEELPLHLNKFRLLVLPSYTEGLPNVMLEAMACETPVLAMPVGSVPDVIVDGQTGFIMKGNAPSDIAEGIVRALGSSELGDVAESARRHVINEFSIDRSLDRWTSLFERVKFGSNPDAKRRQ
jgi:glycosyltransferase involved in cell wall biosynthesis